MSQIDRRAVLAGAAATTLLTTASRAQKPGDQAAPDLSGKAILITGCSSGFGRLGAEHYARRGAKVFATMRNLPRPEAEELASLAKNQKLDITILELDVLDEDMVNRAVAEAETLAGRGLDVVINNAGLGITGPVEVQDIEATRLAFDTNVFGCLRVARATLPAMRARKSGLIVSISSQLGRVIAPFAGLYSSTKFALEAMSEQLAYELVPHGIDVTIVEPGAYPTKVWVNRNGYTAALKDRVATKHADGYPAAMAEMGKEDGSGRTADPMDVPRAIAHAIALPGGSRPLRLPVSGGAIPQTAINDVAAKVQVEWLGTYPGVGDLVRAVHEA